MAKKIFALILAGALSASLVACGGDNTPDTDAATDSETVLDTDSETVLDTDTDAVIDTDTDESLEEDFEFDMPVIPEPNEKITGVYNAIKEAYGEGYVPSMRLDPEMLAANYYIDAEWVASYVAEMPMMMTHVDTLIIVEPTEGNTENVLGALEDYYDYLVNDSMQYPMNIEKVRAAQVFEKDGLVFFFMLGMMSDDAIMAEGTEEEIAAIQYAEAVANNQIAIDAINSVLGE